MSAAQDFADALQRFEQNRDIEAFLPVFAEDVELRRPETKDVQQGVDGARDFWQRYLEQFDEIASSFSRVAQAEGIGELEWTGEGRLATGRQISYAGCSLMEFGSDGRVSRFTTYYDTAAFVQPTN